VIGRDSLVGVMLAMAALGGLRWASTAPMTVNASSDAMLRLAWSARPERIETCREPSDEERSKLPRHMQQKLVCEGRAATYRLEVRHEGATIAEQIVRGGGLRHDRRLYVFRELPLRAGTTRLDIRFERIEADEPDERGSDERGHDERRPHERSPSGRDAIPPRLILNQEITLSPREVVLVTYDAERRTLVVNVARGERTSGVHVQ